MMFQLRFVSFEGRRVGKNLKWKSWHERYERKRNDVLEMCVTGFDTSCHVMYSQSSKHYLK